eukprot:731444-Pelagomonas_calceolata.AAC.3
MAGDSSRPQMEPRCSPEKAKETELARSSGGTAREMMSTMEEGAIASPRPVIALRRRWCRGYASVYGCLTRMELERDNILIPVCGELFGQE